MYRMQWKNTNPKPLLNPGFGFRKMGQVSRARGFQSLTPTNQPTNQVITDNPPHLKLMATLPCNLSLITTLVTDCPKFSDITILQDGVVTCLRSGGIFNDNLLQIYCWVPDERILKIVQHLAKLQATVQWLLFWLTMYIKNRPLTNRQSVSPVPKVAYYQLQAKYHV